MFHWKRMWTNANRSLVQHALVGCRCIRVLSHQREGVANALHDLVSVNFMMKLNSITFKYYKDSIEMIVRARKPELQLRIGNLVQGHAVHFDGLDVFLLLKVDVANVDAQTHYYESEDTQTS